MTALHSIRWTLARYGGLVGDVICTAPEGADCRLAGGVDCHCEEWTVERDANGPYHRADYDDDFPEIHRMVDMGECNVELFLEASEIAELGPIEAVVGELPIEPVWDGSGYEWKPARVQP